MPTGFPLLLKRMAGFIRFIIRRSRRRGDFPPPSQICRIFLWGPSKGGWFEKSSCHRGDGYLWMRIIPRSNCGFWHTCRMMPAWWKPMRKAGTFTGWQRPEFFIKVLRMWHRMSAEMPRRLISGLFTASVLLVSPMIFAFPEKRRNPIWINILPPIPEWKNTRRKQ